MAAEANGSLTEVYEVETILDYQWKDSKDYYLVKWKNWPLDNSTWEPIEHLHCHNLLTEFHRHHPRSLQSVRSQARVRNYSNSNNSACQGVNKKTISRQSVGCRRRPLVKLQSPPAKLIRGRQVTRNGFQDSMDGDCVEFLEDFKQVFKNGKWAFERIKKGQFLVYKRKKTKLEAFEEKRVLLAKLKVWENEINRVCRRYHEKPVKVENSVDFEGPPSNFKYVTKCIPGRNVLVPNEPLIGCTCSDCKDNSKGCCAAGMGAMFAYTRTGKINLLPGLPVYECNSRCACSSDCPNRVVQKGRQVEISIFRTSDGRGWGVKTLNLIEKDSFVMEYVGEIIRAEEAERRGRRYDMEGMTYLFDLDFNDAAVQYVIDAKQYGNASHFINHSCDPNLAVYAVWVEHLDVFLPRIAFFALRDIEPNEELTFDYVMSSGIDNQAQESSSSESLEHSIDIDDGSDDDDDPVRDSEVPVSRCKGRIPCKCGSDRCRGFLYFGADS